MTKDKATTIWLRTSTKDELRKVGHEIYCLTFDEIVNELMRRFKESRNED